MALLSVATLAAAALAASMAAGPAPAAAKPEPTARLAQCRTVAESSARLACYDAAAAALERAEAGGEVVILDQQRIREVRRESFGLAGGAELERVAPAAPAAAVEQVVLTVQQAWLSPDGDWVMAMNDGQVWRQIDGRLARAPEAGSSAEIRRAALGSYLLKLDGQKAVRARREK